MSNTYKCIDAGSEFCPCHLAETMDCISCSQLQGKNTCDCGWNGVCILNEFYMNNKKVNGSRKAYSGYVILNKEIYSNVFMLKIKTDKNLVKQLNRSGSYVLLKAIDKDYFYNVPMSILDLDGDEYFYIVYKNKGSKTKSLDKVEILDIKGPYWNGIQGINYLKQVKNSNCLVIARGIGQSSVVLPIREMIRNSNKIFLFLDSGNMNLDYALDFLNDDLTVIKGDLYKDSQKIQELIINNNIKLVFSSGSDLVHNHIINLIKDVNENINYMTSNNSTICCSEGICGSCIRRIETGKKVRMCKSQLNPKKLFS
ncbi:sulfide/dihydroorotate dehydrogenase-like FAD/NAD-binding protein [Anaerosalibacter sp. Marseille-P3206]|uniref:sulfide/dihydroorotate dehydrogenase-like FAD/NAD-binding protein n=1 Tax=Anaerosalibacter sp. Marseille-P3206 TaxID=1871005 RepID=UPI0009861035|nr:sulfide/dihydroorotate dehydrogenase-like FAD/NAD-binding protein [Anaerosalibacter sp. Marseille-P3206]